MVTFLNMLPSKNGISNKLRPAAIIPGSPNLDYNKLKIKLGSYAQVYIGTTHITKQRTVGTIALIPENEQGRHDLMSLETRKQLHTYIWTKLPISE